MIPKIIHYCWFGGNKKPTNFTKYYNSWKEKCPDYEIIEWNESNFDIDSCCIYVREAYNQQKWAFVSDYARLKILYEYGGIYLDTDVELIKNLDILLDNHLYMGMEPPNFTVNTGLGFGSEKGASFLKELLDIYENVHFINQDGSLNLKTCGQYTNELLKKKGFIEKKEIQIIENVIKIYPSEFFCPLNWNNNQIELTPNTYSIHHYDYSWASNIDKEIHKHEQIINKFLGKYVGSIISYIYRKTRKFVYKVTLFFHKNH